MLKSITGIPWDPQAIREEPAIAAPREPIIASPSGEALVQPPAIDDKKRKLRRLYITKKDLEKFGYTAGCPACDSHRLAKDLQASITPTGVETDLKSASEEEKKRIHEWQDMKAELERQSLACHNQSVVRDLKSFMAMKAKDHRESPIHVGCSHDLTSKLIVSKPQCQEDLIGLLSGTELQETMQTMQSSRVES